ncbi:hypothetical protein D3C81_1361540 [compost metagenome]
MPSQWQHDRHGPRAGRPRPARWPPRPSGRSRCWGRSAARVPGRRRSPRARRAGSPTTRPRWWRVPRGGGRLDRAAARAIAARWGAHRGAGGRRSSAPPLSRSEGGGWEGVAVGLGLQREATPPQSSPCLRQREGTAQLAPWRSPAAPAETPVHRPDARPRPAPPRGGSALPGLHRDGPGSDSPPPDNCGLRWTGVVRRESSPVVPRRAWPTSSRCAGHRAAATARPAPAPDRDRRTDGVRGIRRTAVHPHLPAMGRPAACGSGCLR